MSKLTKVQELEKKLAEIEELKKEIEKELKEEKKKKVPVKKPPEEVPEPELYEGFDDAAIDRISDKIDTEGNYPEVRRKVGQQFPKWSQRQKSKATMGIIDRRIEEDEKPLEVKKQRIIQKRTTLAGKGFGKKRVSMLRDESGKYIGKPANITTYTRAGKLRFKNIKTGKKGILGELF